MKRHHRVLVSVLVVAISVVLVGSLVLVGRESGGPIRAALDAVGGVVSRTEARMARRLRGPGRAEALQWLAPIRTNADSLRQPGEILLGAFTDEIPASLDGVLRLEDSLGTALAVIQAYTAWGDRPDQQFPRRIVEAIRDLGSIPLVTWEPWLVDFENRLHPHLPLRDDRDRGGLAAIAAGQYDFYLDAWAREAVRFGSPLLVRLAHEMNDAYRYPWGPHNNQPADFVAAWRHVVERFRAAGAHNVVWVWAPHVAYEGYEWFYPGDDVVDWVGTGTLNYGTVALWSQWWSFDEIFGRHYERLAGFGKPIMIAEFGTLAVGGDRPAWYRAALADLPARFPLVRALLFFHVKADATITYQALDWAFTEDGASLAAIREAVRGWR
ncbi:MAG: glycoside hydrolase family 26 protein [Gemmatimonadales bacterium]